MGQRSLKVIEIGAIRKLGCGFYSPSIVTMTVSVWRDLENQVRGGLRSLKTAPFDRPYAIFYWSAIVTIVLSCTNCELLDAEYYTVTLKYEVTQRH